MAAGAALTPDNYRTSYTGRGCGRLEVTTRQRDVLENGTRHDEVLTYQLSFCSDGRFPEPAR